MIIVAYFSLLSCPHFCWLLCILIVTSLPLAISRFTSPLPLLPWYQVSQCMMSQCPGLATSITGFARKRPEATLIGHTTNGCFLCSGQLAGPAVFHQHLDVIWHYSSSFFQNASNLCSHQSKLCPDCLFFLQ